MLMMYFFFFRCVSQPVLWFPSRIWIFFSLIPRGVAMIHGTWLKSVLIVWIPTLIRNNLTPSIDAGWGNCRCVFRQFYETRGDAVWQNEGFVMLNELVRVSILKHWALEFWVRGTWRRGGADKQLAGQEVLQRLHNQTLCKPQLPKFSSCRLYYWNSVCISYPSDTHAVFTFLGAFATLRIATISSVMSVRMEKHCSHWTDFDEICYLRPFSKICRENSSFIKNRQE